MAYQNITIDRADQVATVTLNRPDAFNALNLALGRDLFNASIELDEEIYKTDPRKTEALTHLQTNYKTLAELAELVGERDKAEIYRAKIEEIKARIKN